MSPGYSLTGNEPWQRWHEVFSSDGWSWIAGNITLTGTNTQVAGLSTQITQGGGPADTHFDNIDFFFNPVPSGTAITVTKTMRFEGLDVSLGTGQWGSDDIVIREFPLPPREQPPIPEPATLGMIGLGIAMAGLLRRRRTA